jgi:hypothetical protein
MVEEEAVDHPIPDVPVTVTILVVSVAVVFTVWVPVIMYRAAIRRGRSTSESLRLPRSLRPCRGSWRRPRRDNDAPAASPGSGWAVAHLGAALRLIDQALRDQANTCVFDCTASDQLLLSVITATHCAAR